MHTNLFYRTFRLNLFSSIAEVNWQQSSLTVLTIDMSMMKYFKVINKAIKSLIKGSLMIKQS